VAKILSCALLTLVAVSSGCGYHQVGAATHLPANVRTLAVPVFQSKVQGFRTETAFTQAVARVEYAHAVSRADEWRRWHV